MRHAVLTSARIGIFLAMLAPVPLAFSGEAATLDRARDLIAAAKESEAAEVLEDALPTAPKAERGAMLSLLRQTYGSLAKQAQEKGRGREADLYRDNLAILDREIGDAAPAATPGAKPPTGRGPATAPESPPQASLPIMPPKADDTKPLATKPLPEPRRLPEPEPLPPIEESSPEKPGRPTGSGSGAKHGDPSAPSREAAAEEAANLQTRKRQEIGSQLTLADQAFRGRRYDEAGRLYSSLASRKELPKDRNEAWAYCRWTDVVRRINTKPRSAKEWDTIEAEIKSIRELNPNNWYGEYLLSRVAEARKARRSLFPSRTRNEKVVVRGAEPEEVEVNLPGQRAPKASPENIRLDVNDRKPGPGSPARPKEDAGDAGVWPSDAAASAPLPSPAESTAPATVMNGQWQVRETPNFRIHHRSPQLAERAGQIAESVRSGQGKRWSSPASTRTWSPKCDLYLYPDSRVFAKMTGQPETSPGFTMMGANGGKIISRRVNLRADHPQLLTAILPHEVTHVVLADLFPDQPIPRWADEGMAVLAEPPAEQQSRSAELASPLQENRIFTIADLVALDYPDAKTWPVYYAQSISLTRFLFEQGQPADFIRFLQATQRNGMDVALRNIYRINDLAELQDQWLTYARIQASNPDVARSDREPLPQAETETR